MDAIDQPHQINHSPPKTPENTANMSETKITPPISSLQCSSSRPTSPTSSTVPVQESNTATMQSDEDSADITVAKPSTQIQHAQAPQLDSMIAPTSNVEADHTTQSSKRSREEDSSSSAFGTPPPKRASKAKATANAKKATKKTAPPKKAAPKKSTPQKAATPAPSRSQPPRNRRAPDHLKDFQETTPPKPLPNKKSCSKVFDPVFITTNSNSRLVKADIYVSQSLANPLSNSHQTAHASRRPRLDKPQRGAAKHSDFHAPPGPRKPSLANQDQHWRD